MTNKGLILAAVFFAGILGTSIIFSVGIVEHRRDVRNQEQERKADCAEQRAGLDRCIAGTYSQEVHDQCKKYWQPVIDKACSK